MKDQTRKDIRLTAFILAWCEENGVDPKDAFGNVYKKTGNRIVVDSQQLEESEANVRGAMLPAALIRLKGSSLEYTLFVNTYRDGSGNDVRASRFVAKAEQETESLPAAQKIPLTGRRVHTEHKDDEE